MSHSVKSGLVDRRPVLAVVEGVSGKSTLASDIFERIAKQMEVAMRG